MRSIYSEIAPHGCQVFYVFRIAVASLVTFGGMTTCPARLQQEYTLRGIQSLIDAGVAIVLPDIAKTGGFTGLALWT